MAVVAGARLVTPDGVIDGWLETSGTTIAALGAGEPPGIADRDVSGCWVVPGFVDMHAHGGGGETVVGAGPEQVVTFANTHLACGTTTIMASLVSGYYDDLERDVRVLSELVDDGVVAGIHLEGPWISAKRRGAHSADALRHPEPPAVARMLEAGRGTVRMVTLAPELESGLDTIRAVTDSGAIAAVGHTDANYDTARQAVDAGATVATHLFNAMSPIHHRDPGPVVALLEDDRVSIELVCDGIHLHPAIASMAHRLAGTNRTVLITDSMAAAGYADGHYLLGDREVNVENGVARLVENGSIAGSTLTMDRAFAFAVHRAGFSIEDAVAASSVNPARLIGVADRTGSLVAGLDADLVILGPELELRAVMKRGEWVEGSSS